MYGSIQQGFIYIIYAASLLSEGENLDLLPSIA
jgi:hypothetical protein